MHIFSKRVRNCFGNSFFFFFGIFVFWLGVVLGLYRLLFGKTRRWNAGSCGFFRTFGGGFRAVQAPFWETTGEMQVPSRFGGRKTASKSKLSRSFLFSVCIYLCWCVCVCVCDRVCSMCFLSIVVLIFHSMYFFSCIYNLSIWRVNICSRFKFFVHKKTSKKT